ncbi:hypothetical protein HanIR_Chr04g0197771 [Helianthus annuus]|nr:hypothetical protein HanIR_Chr04g0197771 [Helianthus annuus]
MDCSSKTKQQRTQHRFKIHDGVMYNYNQFVIDDLPESPPPPHASENRRPTTNVESPSPHSLDRWSGLFGCGSESVMNFVQIQCGN